MTFLQDLRTAARALRRSPGTTLLALTCLALGIGATTAIFSVVHAVLLGDLPYRDSRSLVRLDEVIQPHGAGALYAAVSAPDFRDFRDRSHSLTDLAAYQPRNMNLAGDPPVRLAVTAASANLFDVLGARPILGRTFLPGEDARGAPGVVVLSEGLWRTRFGGRSTALGSTVTLDGRPFTIVGVMPDRFDFPIGPSHQDAWAPLWPAARAEIDSRGAHFLHVVGRLRKGASVSSANLELTEIAADLRRAYPDDWVDRGASVRSAAEVVVGDVRTPLLVLLGAVTLVLFIACANVASLLLARATLREREVAIRTALGARPGRIARWLLTESVLLAALGGTLGLGVAAVSLKAILVLAAPGLPRASQAGLDPVVLGFAVLLSCLTGVVFGLAPLRRAVGTDLREGLMSGGQRTGADPRQQRFLRNLVATEIAVSLVLAAGAGVLVRSFVRLMRTDPGFHPVGVLTFRTRTAFGSDSTTYLRFYGPALGRIRALAGVRTTGLISALPLQTTGNFANVDIIGRGSAGAGQQPLAEFRVVSADYFTTLGIPVVTGRGFDDRDRPGSVHVGAVNEAFVRKYLHDEQPIGRRLQAWSPDTFMIVGVVGDVRQSGIDQDARPEIYVSAAQNPWLLGGGMSFVIASSIPPDRLVGPVRAALRAVAPDQPIFSVETMEQVITDSLRGRALTLTLLGVLTVLAVVLAAAGVYGVMNYAVARRMRELGIRMALGASAGTLTRMVLTDASRLAGWGIALGTLGALALLSLLQGLVFGVSTHDPLTLGIAVVLILGVALAASALPALRAARADPLSVIRAE